VVLQLAAEVSRAAPFASYERRTLAITDWPCCFTDQYDVGIMYAGSVLLESDDVVSVETCRGRCFTVFGLKQQGAGRDACRRLSPP
jgi:hypothetical protein